MNFQDFLLNEGTIIEKKTQEHVFMQGNKDPSIYFIKTGLLKGYYISTEGKESVKSFLMAGDIIGSLTSAFAKQENSFSLICLEPSSLIQFSFDKLHEYSLIHHEMANTVIKLLLNFAMKKEQREREFLCLSAEERYRSLLKNKPILLEKVTQNDIARFLGITPVGLSRIKKRINENLG